MSRLVLFGVFLTSVTVTALGSVSALTADDHDDDVAIVRLDDQRADHAARVAALERGFEELKQRIDELLARRSGQVVTPRGEAPVIRYRVDLGPDQDSREAIMELLVDVEEGRLPAGGELIEIHGHDDGHAHDVHADHDHEHADHDDHAHDVHADHDHKHADHDDDHDVDLDLDEMRAHLEQLAREFHQQGHDVDLEELHEHLMELAEEHLHGDHADAVHERLKELDEHLHHGDEAQAMRRQLEEMAEFGISIDEEQMEELAAYLEQLVEREAENFMPLLEEAMARIERLVEREAPYFEELIEEAMASLEDVLANEEESIENFVQEFEEGVEDAMVDEGEHLESLIQAALEHLEEVVERESPHFESLIEEAMEHVDSIIQDEGGAFEELVERAMQQLEEIIEREMPVIEEMMQPAEGDDPFASRFETLPPVRHPDELAPPRLRRPLPPDVEGHHQRPAGRIMGHAGDEHGEHQIVVLEGHGDGEMIFLPGHDDDDETYAIAFGWDDEEPAHGDGGEWHVDLEGIDGKVWQEDDGTIRVWVGGEIGEGLPDVLTLDGAIRELAIETHGDAHGHGLPNTDELEEIWEHARHVIEMGDDIQDPRTIALMAILQSRKLEPMARVEVLMPVLHEIDDPTLRAAAMMALLEVADDTDDPGMAIEILRMIIIESDELID